MDKIEELKKDIAELEGFLRVATRQKCKDILTIDIRKLISEVVNIEEKIKNQSTSVGDVKGAGLPISTPSSQRYETKITNYAWDQSENYIKFYITLKNIHTIAAENVSCEFSTKGLSLLVQDLENKNHSWQIKNLLNEIDSQKSSWKIKTDMLVINCAKKTPGKWSHLTEWEKKASESKVPKFDSERDPSESLMTLMKNMYETGDDEMKRTIAKAWTESSNKKSSGDFF